MDQTKCWYCAQSEANHSDVCPTKDADPAAAVAEWKKGYNSGFNDEFVRWYERRYHTPHFLRGYDAGAAEIESLVDAAVEDRINGVGGREY